MLGFRARKEKSEPGGQKKSRTDVSGIPANLRKNFGSSSQAKSEKQTRRGRGNTREQAWRVPKRRSSGAEPPRGQSRQCPFYRPYRFVCRCHHPGRPLHPTTREPPLQPSTTHLVSGRPTTTPSAPPDLPYVSRNPLQPPHSHLTPPAFKYGAPSGVTRTARDRGLQRGCTGAAGGDALLYVPGWLADDGVELKSGPQRECGVEWKRRGECWNDECCWGGRNSRR